MSEVSGFEPPQKNTQSQNKLFINRLESAKHSKSVFKIVDVKDISLNHRLYEIANKENARKYSQVNICSQPSCSCKDFSLYGSKTLCKHILFILLYVYNVTDLTTLSSLDFGQNQIEDFFKISSVDQQFMKKKVRAQKKKNKNDFQEILCTHSNFNDPQVYKYHLKNGRSAKCSGMNCTTILQPGTACVKVDGAISVQYEQNFAIKRTFYFCANSQCVMTPPVWSNIRRPSELLQGPNTSDAIFETLLESLF